MENSLSEQILKVLENNSRLTNQEIAIMLGVDFDMGRLDERMVVTP
ncbi:MAG: winged helix-turn-helix transcriptional regulator [Lachnospiraceae bacterium]|nr:winged helix-turn-helix transcriptional regulator [Lachnospiraceae bacterium]